MKAYVLALIISLSSFIVNGDTDVEHQFQTKSTLAATTNINHVSKTKITKFFQNSKSFNLTLTHAVVVYGLSKMPHGQSPLFFTFQEYPI